MARANLAAELAEARKQIDKVERSLADGSWGGAARAFDAAMHALTEARWQASKVDWR